MHSFCADLACPSTMWHMREYENTYKSRILDVVLWVFNLFSLEFFFNYSIFLENTKTLAPVFGDNITKGDTVLDAPPDLQIPPRWLLAN